MTAAVSDIQHNNDFLYRVCYFVQGIVYVVVIPNTQVKLVVLHANHMEILKVVIDHVPNLFTVLVITKMVLDNLIDLSYYTIRDQQDHVMWVVIIDIISGNGGEVLSLEEVCCTVLKIEDELVTKVFKRMTL